MEGWVKCPNLSVRSENQPWPVSLEKMYLWSLWTEMCFRVPHHMQIAAVLGKQELQELTAKNILGQDGSKSKGNTLRGVGGIPSHRLRELLLPRCTKRALFSTVRLHHSTFCLPTTAHPSVMCQGICCLVCVQQQHLGPRELKFTPRSASLLRPGCDRNCSLCSPSTTTPGCSAQHQ